MRRWVLLLAAGLTGCASEGAPPSAHAIARIESGFALLDDLQSVGVADSGAMNRAARTRVRNVQCTAPEPARADCRYEASRMIRPPEWLLRSRSFVRGAQISSGLPSADGWTVVPTGTGAVPEKTVEQQCDDQNFIWVAQPDGSRLSVGQALTDGAKYVWKDGECQIIGGLTVPPAPVRPVP